MVKRYRVTLTDEERERLEGLTRKRTASVRMVRRAQALLLAAEEQDRRGDRASSSGSGVATLERTASAVRGGGAGGVAAGAAPAGRAPEAGAEGAGVRGGAGLHEAAGGAAPLDDAAPGRPGGGAGARPGHLRRGDPAAPQKNQLKPWLQKEWVIPTVGAEFVCRMEDVLDLYAEPLRPGPPGRLLRRDQQATGRRDPHPAADGAGQARAGRLRVRAQGDRQPLPGHPAARRPGATST